MCLVIPTLPSNIGNYFFNPYNFKTFPINKADLTNLQGKVLLAINELKKNKCYINNMR